MAEENELELSNKKLIQNAFAAWRDGTGNVFDLLAADATWTIVGNAPVSRTFKNKQEFLDVVITPFNQRMSDRLRPTAPSLYADGDTVVALFDGEGTALDGKPYRNTYAWFMQMSGGKIIRVTAFFDTIEFTDFWNRIQTGQKAKPAADFIRPPKNSASPFADMRGHHVAMRTRSLAEAKQFYVGKLDFRVVAEWSFADQQLAYLAPPTDDNFYIEILGGGATLPAEDRPYTDLVQSLKYYGYHHFCLNVASVDETVARLRARGVAIIAEPFVLPAINRKLAFFADPVGNLIEIAEVLA